MSVYHSSFNYLGINSRLKNLVVAQFEPDQGEQETFLNLEPIYTDSALGLRRHDYGAKYSSVATFRLNVIKSDNSDFNVAEIRDCLKWLTGTTTNSTLDLLIGENIKVSFIGRITNVWQYKMDARTVGMILEFTSASPFAYSPKQTITRSISGTESLQIYCPSDDLYSSVYLQTKYTNIEGDSLIIDNTTTGETTEVTELSLNEIVTIDGDLMIVSDKPNKVFGDTFNFVFPRLISGINTFLITANGDISFEYSYPMKIGDLAIDIEELSAAIDCDSNPGPGTVITEYTTWENILNKPSTVDGYGITDVYTMSEADALLAEKATNEQLAEVTDRVTTNENDIITLQEVKADQADVDAAVEEINDAISQKANQVDLESVTEEVAILKEGKADRIDLESAKEEIDTLREEVDALQETKANKTDLDAAINEINNELGQKADQIDLDKVTEDVGRLQEAKADVATTLAGYGITDAYTKTEVDTKITSVYKYMGSVQNESLLPAENLEVGYVYNLEDTGMNMAWNGIEWDALGSTIDLTPYLLKDEASNLYSTKTEINTTVEEINNEIGKKADKSELDIIIGDVTTLQETKANKSDVESIIEEVDSKINEKADQTELNDVVNDVNTLQEIKADKADVDSVVADINKKIDQKLDQAEIDDIVQEINGKIDQKVDQSQINSMTEEIDGKLDQKANQSDIDTVIQEIEMLQETKVDKATTLAGYGIADAYTKDEIDEQIANAQPDNVYTKDEVDALLSSIRIDIDEEELNTMLAEVLI